MPVYSFVFDTYFMWLKQNLLQQTEEGNDTNHDLLHYLFKNLSQWDGITVLGTF